MNEGIPGVFILLGVLNETPAACTLATDGCHTPPPGSWRRASRALCHEIPKYGESLIYAMMLMVNAKQEKQE
jgi:hypothetical protein